MLTPSLKRILTGVFVVSTIIVIFVFLQHPSQPGKANQKNKHYIASLHHLRENTNQLNKQFAGKEIYKNTRLDSVKLNEQDKMVTYQMTLLDISEIDIKRISNEKRQKIIAGERQFLIKKNRSDNYLAPLFEQGWSIEYIQRTNDGTIISHIAITSGDMAKPPASEPHDVI